MEANSISFYHRQSDRPVIKDISFKAERGKITAILGPNGAGKTTLFKCISGLWKPQRGDILFEGKSIIGMSYSKRAKIIAVVPQEHEPPFPYSVFDVVLMGRAMHLGIFSSPSKKDFEKAMNAINLVGIEHLKEQPYTKISGGERQLTLIARAIAQDAPVMVLDEPTSHLDYRNQILVLKKIKEIIKEKQIIAIVTIHDPNLAMHFSDNTLMIKEGRIIADGETKIILNEENLKKLYDVNVALISAGNTRFIIPVTD